MNLHAITSPYTRVVSPVTVGAVYVSAGQVKAADYTVGPAFTKYEPVAMDVQALSGRDLKQIDGVNLQGTLRSVYMNGNLEGLDRPAGKGGDVLYFGGQWWLITMVLEPWDANGWTKIIATLQNGKPPGIA